MTKEIKFLDLSGGTQTLIILAFAISLALLIVFFLSNPNLKDIARWECHNETTERWVTLKGRVCEYDEDYFNNQHCFYDGARTEYNKETDEVNCEDGVDVCEFTEEITNLTPDPKKCLIKTTKEVCKIV